LPAIVPGRTNGLPSIRGSSVRSARAGAPKGTTFAPVFESGSRRQLRAKSRYSHLRVSISDLRQPVSTNRRIAVSATGFSASSAAFGSGPCLPVAIHSSVALTCAAQGLGGSISMDTRTVAGLAAV
jgi:hypothetical protein